MPAAFGAQATGCHRNGQTHHSSACFFFPLSIQCLSADPYRNDEQTFPRKKMIVYVWLRLVCSSLRLVVGSIRALPIQDSITESKIINYILFMVFY